MKHKPTLTCDLIREGNSIVYVNAGRRIGQLIMFEGEAADFEQGLERVMRQRIQSLERKNAELLSEIKDLEEMNMHLRREIRKLRRSGRA